MKCLVLLLLLYVSLFLGSNLVESFPVTSASVRSKRSSNTRFYLSTGTKTYKTVGSPGGNGNKNSNTTTAIAFRSTQTTQNDETTKTTPTEYYYYYETARNEYKYIMLGLLWTIAVLSALDRVAMSVAIVPMAEEFAFSDTTKGSVSSLFSVGYGIGILPAGLLLSNISPRLIMAIGLGTWSLATMATPLCAEFVATTMTPLFIVRALVGAAESVVLPTVQRSLATWTSAQEKSVALAAIFSGFQVGTILAYWASPIVMDLTHGWRGLFYAYGAVGVFMMAPWLVWAKDAPSKLDGTVKQQSPWEQAETMVRQAPWKALVRSPGTWGMLLAHSAKNVGLYISLAWTPTFYAEQYGIGVRDSAWFSVLPSVAGAIGGLAAGVVADAVVRNYGQNVESLTRIRKVFQGMGLLGPAVFLGMLAWHIPEDPTVAQFFLTAAVGFQAFNAAGFEAGNQEKAGEKWAGLLYSVTSLPAVLVGTAGVQLTGVLLDWTQQDWSYVFGLNALINVAGATAFLLLYDSKKEFD